MMAVLFHPDHCRDAVARGVSLREQQSNLDLRAKQLGGFFTDAITGRLGDLDKLMLEARELKRYREAFTNWLLDHETSPVGALGMPLPYDILPRTGAK
jgi:hypothetical protein